MRFPRVLIADDHPIVITGLRELLEPEFDIVGTAGDGQTLVKLATSLKPDVVLLDISMPVLNGLSAARQIKKSLPRAKLIFLTMHADADYVREAFRAGASGYILKRSVASELVSGIREVLKRGMYLAPGLAVGLEIPVRKPPTKSMTSSGDITNREREVLQLVSEGHPSKEIAGILNITRKAVEYHKSMMKRKLHLQTTAELIRYAVENKITGT